MSDLVCGEKLVLAVPSKGRLQENANAFFGRAGLTVTQGRGARDYRGALSGVEGVEVAFLSASEIVKNLASGAAHLGVTGEDLVREAQAESQVALLTPLGFGHANVVVAVPQAWIDVRNMADLEDVAAGFRARRGERMRVATKYVNTTRAFFRDKGVTDYHIVESLGATEGAPAAGLAELIVDITSTGATLAANGLKILDDGVILRSEANLVASLGAVWTPALREVARKILSRIAAEEEARTTREINAALSREPEDFVAQLARFSAKLRRRGADGEMVFVAPKGQAPALADFLIAEGADHVAVRQLDYVFTSHNPLYERLIGRLGPSVSA
jgi:ATP phosphoribosyltransferase